MVRADEGLRQRLRVEHVDDVLGRQHVAGRLPAAWNLGRESGREKRGEQQGGAQRTADRHGGLLFGAPSYLFFIRGASPLGLPYTLSGRRGERRVVSPRGRHLDLELAVGVHVGDERRAL